MKTKLNPMSRVALLCAGLLTAALPCIAQITVKVDSTRNWLGWMNVFDTNNAYIYGQSWGAADLRARFVPSPTNATRVVLAINTNSYNTGGFWNLADGTPNKLLEANFYVDVGTQFAGNDVTFIGTVESNTLPAGWTCEAVIKEFRGGYAYVGDTRAPLVSGEPFSVTRYIAPGNITQYGFLLYGPNTPPGSPAAAEAVSVLVDNADPSITAQPANQRTTVGGTARFSVTAVSSSALSYQWKRYGTNLADGGNISGAKTATLTISNAQPADATVYQVTVTSAAGSLDSQPARLRVLTPEEYVNWLDNPGFELDVVDPILVPEPWVNFSGSALVQTADYGIPPVDGTNAASVSVAGEWNGVYQDVPAAPGDMFTGDGWFYMTSWNYLNGECEAHIEVQFRAGETPLAMWVSSPVTNTSPMDTWLFLQATNGVAAGWTQITTSNAHYLVAPPGTDRVRYQISLHNIAGGSGTVYFDALRLMKKLPVRLSATRSGANVVISWLTQAATSYQVVYKQDLSDPTWMPLGEPVLGDGGLKSVSYPAGGERRFYSVLTQ